MVIPINTIKNLINILLLAGFNPYGYMYCLVGFIDLFGLAKCPYAKLASKLQKREN